MAIKYEDKRKFQRNVQSFYNRLEKLSGRERAVASKEFLKFERELENLSAKIEKGFATKSELSRMINRLQSYKNQKLTKFIDIYDPETDRIYKWGQRPKKGYTESITPGKYRKDGPDFRNIEDVVNRYRKRAPEPEPEWDYDAFDYYESLMNEIMIFIRSNIIPKWEWIATVIEELIAMLVSRYGMEKAGKLIDEYEKDLRNELTPASNFYADYLVPLRDFLIHLEFELSKDGSVHYDDIIHEEFAKKWGDALEEVEEWVEI